MKYLLISLISFSIFAAQTSCKYTDSFVYGNWKIHSPKRFDILFNDVVKSLNDGINSGHITPDLEGHIFTRSSHDGTFILLDTMSWDDSRTVQDEMYGDIAIMMTNLDEDPVEVRWYDGERRNVVFNPKFLKCFSEPSPVVDNSVL